MAEIAIKENTFTERFTNKVMELFVAGAGGDLALTDFQQRLAQNYCIVADRALRAAEEKRIKKSEKYRDPLPVTWANVDMDDLAQSVVSAARIGWDPMQSNHAHLIPYKSNATNKYSMTIMPGYRGIELRAQKYGLNVPDAVIVELVYSTDHFVSIKKDRDNAIESYEFRITNDFNRGEIIGGFYYHVYNETPQKNKLVVYTIQEIEKRRPDYASPDFWGGEKNVWKKDEKTGESKVVGKEKVDGWRKEMCWKTMYRAAYNDITIDSQKIDDNYMQLKNAELALAEAEINQEIADNANKEYIDVTATTIAPEAPEPEEGPTDLPATGTDGGTLGPDF